VKSAIVTISCPTCELSYLLMRAFQELVQNTEFMHYLEG
jgi:hypothetical protein